MLGTEETLSLSTVPVAEDAAVTGATYGPLKAACERRAMKRFGTSTTMVRPTYVVGSHDATYRFPYWVARLQRGGRVLVPGPTTSLLQWIDARDLAEFTLGILEREVEGAFHVAGPTPAMGFPEVIAQIAEHVAPLGTELVEVDGLLLLELETTPGIIPLWTGPHQEPVMNVDPAKAVAAGLRFRSLSDTVDDVASWLVGQAWQSHWLTPEREAELLDR
jgi:2'-hydroxyisoflavone reductase